MRDWQSESARIRWRFRFPAGEFSGIGSVRL